MVTKIKVPKTIRVTVDLNMDEDVMLEKQDMGFKEADILESAKRAISIRHNTMSGVHDFEVVKAEILETKEV